MINLVVTILQAHHTKQPETYKKKNERNICKIILKLQNSKVLEIDNNPSLRENAIGNYKFRMPKKQQTIYLITTTMKQNK